MLAKLIEKTTFQSDSSNNGFLMMFRISLRAGVFESRYCFHRKEDLVSLETILIVVLVVFLLGGGGWYYGRR